MKTWSVFCGQNSWFAVTWDFCIKWVVFNYTSETSFLTGLVKSFLYKGMRKKRELLAFSRNLVCHQELCSETVGCRGPHTTPDQERTIMGSSRTQLCPQRHCIPWEQTCSLCLVFFSLLAFSAGSLYQSNQDHKKKKPSWHFTPV